MNLSGNLRKMQVALKDGSADYELKVVDRGNKVLLEKLNNKISNKIKITSHEIYHCVNCDKETKKSFAQGHCFQCFSTLAACDMCIMKPETCHYDQGTCREPRWAESFCMRPHYVYLANSSGIKVGITRENQIPTRWIDQGAVQALPLVKVATRHLSGLIEVELAKFISDKTNWRKMLKGPGEKLDLINEAEKLKEHIEPLLKMYGGELLESEQIEIQYPVENYPEKITSLSLEKTPEIYATLLGIKGQYLIFDTGVINMRKYNGLLVDITL